MMMSHGDQHPKSFQGERFAKIMSHANISKVKLSNFSHGSHRIKGTSRYSKDENIVVSNKFATLAFIYNSFFRRGWSDYKYLKIIAF